MKSFLKWRAKRWGYDGWALCMPNASHALAWTVSTTREECRQIKRDRADLFLQDAEVVKVKVTVEVVR
jgi:hypothetical protein